MGTRTGAATTRPDGKRNLRLTDQRTAPLQSLDLESHLTNPAIKQQFVTPMFELIAGRYDEFTRRFSFGMDVRWKRELLEWVQESAPPNAQVLDVACGTGDIALALALARPDVAVRAVDASPKMLALAAARRETLGVPNVEISAGDLALLAIPDASCDVVTAGYALRNAPEWRDGLKELARVVRPGGHIVTLDFYRPENAVWRESFLRYLAVMGNVYGWLWHREPVAYGYIAKSIDHFVSWREFSHGLEDSGFRVLDTRRKLLGAIAIHFAVRTA